MDRKKYESETEEANVQKKDSNIWLKIVAVLLLMTIAACIVVVVSFKKSGKDEDRKTESVSAVSEKKRRTKEKHYSQSEVAEDEPVTETTKTTITTVEPETTTEITETEPETVTDEETTADEQSTQDAEQYTYATVKLKTEEGSGEKLNIRSGPGYSFDIIGTVNNGDRLALIEEQDGWMHVSGNGLEGWCDIDVAGFFR